jgi:hypothetical protein
MKMTKKCILHGGMPKTGSTSIQQAFFEFDSPDLVYAPLILKTHTFSLWYLFDPDGEERVNALSARRMPKLFHRKKRGLSKRFQSFLESNERNVLISSEVLVNPSLLENREKIVSFLKPYFDEIHLIAYLRAPKDYMVSVMQEGFKASARMFDPHLAYPQYRKRLQPWIETLGPGNVTLIEFDPSRFHGGDVVSDLAARLGVSVNTTGNEKHNKAQSAEAVAAQQLWNRRLHEADLTFYQRAKISFGQREVMKFGKRKFGIDPDLLQNICRENQDDIKWAEDKLGQPFVPYEPKSDAVLFKSEEHFLEFAKDAEQSFWNHVAETWSWRRHSVPALEAIGRTIVGEE